MNVFIMSAPWNNRGDEAAQRAMIDELKLRIPDVEISIQYNDTIVNQYPYSETEMPYLTKYPRKRYYWELPLLLLSRGRIAFSSPAKKMMKNLKNCDYVIFSPGGPGVGDIYLKSEFGYLLRCYFAKMFKKPYFFFAPSMGPFYSQKHRRLRKLALNHADKICVREPISKSYLEEFGIRDVTVTLDSAFQHPLDEQKNKELLLKDSQLSAFLNRYEKVVGMTITDLAWNPKYRGRSDLAPKIEKSFREFLEYLEKKQYGVILIPQLFGNENDFQYLKKYMSGHCFILSDQYDCYFQQYLIGRLSALVGMRYHSNIFAAKMKIPFIPISYEQKMQGFMEKIKLQSYCIDINDLSADLLKQKFETLEVNEDKLRNYLNEIHERLVEESAQTTDLLIEAMKTK